eukprot:524063-Hanusia_phi.AAC.4
MRPMRHGSLVRSSGISTSSEEAGAADGATATASDSPIRVMERERSFPPLQEVVRPVCHREHVSVLVDDGLLKILDGPRPNVETWSTPKLATRSRRAVLLNIAEYISSLMRSARCFHNSSALQQQHQSTSRTRYKQALEDADLPLVPCLCQLTIHESTSVLIYSKLS